MRRMRISAGFAARALRQCSTARYLARARRDARRRFDDAARHRRDMFDYR